VVRLDPGRNEKAAVLSTESIAGSVAAPHETISTCAACGAPLAGDQRYCLECGERRPGVSEFLRSGPPRAAAASAVPPGSRPPGGPAPEQPPRGNALSLLAGVGVLLLAMGVGVLIGRSGGGTARSAPPAEVVTVAGTGASTGASSEAAFSDDWPSGKKGYTVELQVLPQDGTTVAAVEQAKTAAAGKGAGAVGALKSEDFAGKSLPASGYVIYSGEYSRRAAATRALAGLKKKFPTAKVVEVSGGGSGGGAAGAKSGGGGGSGSSLSHPAPAAKLKGHDGASGKKYVEESAKLPDVVSTG
jgi:hypothetical protein